MPRDTESDPASNDSGAIAGRCAYCEWRAATDSYAEMVTAYQDHLREEHPDAWLRA